MIIKEISEEELNSFVLSHPLKNYFQTSFYATLMRKYGYEIFYIGGFKDNNLVAASVILSKYILPTIKYGYAPRGFILDYYDEELLKEFTESLKNYFFKKTFAFIKINPEITYALVNTENHTKIVNETNINIVENLKKYGYKKLKEEVSFNSSLPKLNAIINIDNYDFNFLTSKFKDTINTAKEYGFILQKVTREYIPNVYEILEDKKQSVSFYQDYYDFFIKENMIDALILKLDLATYLSKLQYNYSVETENNNIINTEFTSNPNSNDLYQDKLNSDKSIENIKSNIIKVSSLLKNNKTKYIILACAFVIKNGNRLTFTYYGENKNYLKFNPKEYLLYKIIDDYKDEYKFFDLGGLTLDYMNNENNDNEYKLSFNPSVYEYIGEFDLEINKLLLQVLLNSNKLKNEFKKQDE